MPPPPSPPFHRSVAVVAGSAAEIIADGEVLDGNAINLEDLDAVDAVAAGVEILVDGIRAADVGIWLGAVDDDLVAVHAAEMDAGRLDEDAGDA
jgi:hypothetical protein